MSHRAAGALWGLDGLAAGPVELTIAVAGERRLVGVVVHRTRSLPVADRTEVDGIPVTRPARTVIDLAAVVEHDCLEGAFDCVLREGMCSLESFERRLRDLGPRGSTRVTELHDLVADRRARGVPESPAERRLERQLVAAGPRSVRQYQLEDMRFDFAYPDVRIAVEYDSYRHHYGKRAWRRDQTRHNRATALGWLVFHLTEGESVQPVVQAYRQRSAA